MEWQKIEEANQCSIQWASNTTFSKSFPMALCYGGLSFPGWHGGALARLRELAKLSPNEHFAIHTPTNSIVARMNAPAT